MITPGKLLAVVCITLGLCGCYPVLKRAYSEPRPFSFFGAIAVGDVTREERKIVLRVSVSGGEFATNSGIIPWKAKSEVVGRAIEFTIYTTLADGKNPGLRSIELPGDLKGSYDLRYRDPDGTTHHVDYVTLDSH